MRQQDPGESRRDVRDVGMQTDRKRQNGRQTGG